MVKKKRQSLADKYYNEILKIMHSRLGNDSTYSDELLRTGLMYLGRKFKGVFPSDKIPRLTSLQPYAIINLDNSKQPGSHWVGVAYDSQSDNVIVYDSFGRHTRKILPSISGVYGGKVVDTESDQEQRLKEDNCGQRALAWLILFDKLGPDTALKI